MLPCSYTFHKHSNPRTCTTMAMTNSPPAIAASPLATEILPTAEKAVDALLKWRESKLKTQKPQLLEQDEFVYITLSLKKIPHKGRVNAFKIPIPHRLTDPETSEICLIIDDGSKSSLTKEGSQKKIKDENILVSKVLKISKLRTDYRPFEAKRKLCDSYDMFFADKRVIPLLPKMLGKNFYKKKKIPVPVNLTRQNWKEQIDNCCSSALLYLSAGTCSVVKVARLSMERDEIVKNVIAAITGIAETVPKKWANVRSFHLKLNDSLSLPIYQAAPGIDDIRLKIEGVSDLKHYAIVKEAGEDGKMEKKTKKRGRIQEVQYMDTSIGEIDNEFDSNDDGEAEDDDKKDQNDDMGSKLTSKKRKKGDEKIVKKVVSKEKKESSSFKVKGDDSIKKKKQKKDGSSMKSEAMGVKEKKKRKDGLVMDVKEKMKQKNGEVKEKKKNKK